MHKEKTMKYAYLQPDVERIAREAGRIILGFGEFRVERILESPKRR